MAAPTYVGAGTFRSNINRISNLDFPAGVQAGDIAIAMFETGTSGLTLSGGSETWTEVTGSPVSATGVALTVFWARLSSSSPTAPSTNDTGNHQAGRIHVFRGPKSSGNPWTDAPVTSTDATSDTSVSIDGVTTTVADTLLVYITAGDLPDAAGTAEFDSWANANLTSVTEIEDTSHAANNGGSLGAAIGTLASAGTAGAMTATKANAAVKAQICIPLQPDAAGPQTLSVGKIASSEAVRGATPAGSGSATLASGTIASGAAVRGADLQPQPVTLAIGKIATGEAVRGADMISGFAADTFTDADNTLLSAHTGEIGATWTKHPQSGGGDMKVSSNRLAGSVVADYAFYTPSGTPAGADYDVQATLRTNGDTASVAAVMGRFDTTALTGYRAMYSGFSGTWVLSKFVAGSQVDLGTYAVAATADTDYDVKLEMRGSAIKVYIDGVERISVTDSAITAAGTAGVEIYSTGITLDSFVAVDAVVTALTISTGHIASGATVRGADPAGSGSATLATGKIATGAAVRGASVAGSGSVTVSTGHIASGATVRGASPAGSGSATLTVGRITSGAAVRGVSVAGSGSATLATGHISSVATVRGADVTFSALSLAVGKVSSGAMVRGADVTAGTATIHVGHITAGGRPFGVHLSVKLLDAVTERRMQIDWRRAGRRDRRRRFQ